MDYLHRTWAEIDLDRITHNFEELKRRVRPGCKTMAVVKADAYGHGDGYVSRALQGAGADWFAVSNINEAASLRRQGIEKPILILGVTPPELAGELHKLGAAQTVFCAEYAQALSAQAQAQGVTVDCHIKVDSGMTRIGFFAQRGHEEAAAAEIAAACGLKGLDCSGIFTHFSCADEFSEESKSFTQVQFDTYKRTVEETEKRGVFFSLHHCCNSAATLTHPDWHWDMVRLGVVLYGLNPSPACDGLAELRPALSLYTVVTMVKALEPGAQISYGRRFVTSRSGQKIASLAVGYADGYRRSLTNRGHVLLHGQFASITGTVCMDQMMVEVSGIDGVKAGDTVTLVGEDGEKRITLDDFAALNGTINYEEACLIARRVPRVYRAHGAEIAAVDYVLNTL